MQDGKKKVALVTGATGYVGARLAQRLAGDGWDVHAVIRSASDTSLLLGAAPAAVTHTHDGTTDGMARIVGSIRPRVVFHLASLFLAQHRPDDIEPLVRSNILFGAQLAEAMAAHEVRFLVNTGTSWQHYESASYDPVCLYAATKQAFEAMLQYYLSTTLLSVITLKLFDTYGPGDPRPKLFTILRKAAENPQLLAMSPGEQLIDLVYIDDVTRAFVLAAERLLTGAASKNETYAVSSRAPLSLKRLVEVYSRVTGKDIRVQWGGRPYRDREVMVPWNAGQLLPGWTACIPIEKGILLMESCRA